MTICPEQRAPAWGCRIQDCGYTTGNAGPKRVRSFLNFASVSGRSGINPAFVCPEHRVTNRRLERARPAGSRTRGCRPYRSLSGPDSPYFRAGVRCLRGTVLSCIKASWATKVSFGENGWSKRSIHCFCQGGQPSLAPSASMVGNRFPGPSPLVGADIGAPSRAGS